MAAYYNPYQSRGRIGAIWVGPNNAFGQQMTTLTNPGDLGAFGYGDVETQANKDYGWGALYTTLAPSLSPAARRALLNSRQEIDTGYSDFLRQRGGEGRYADYLGSIDFSRMWREMPAYQSFRNPYSTRVAYRSY